LSAGVLLEPRKLDEDPLCCFGSQIAGLARARADGGLEHEVEILDRFARKIGPTGRTREIVLADAFLDAVDAEGFGVLDVGDGILDQVVGAVTLAALRTLDEHIVEAIQMA